jgi:hypothetical protein
MVVIPAFEPIDFIHCTSMRTERRRPRLVTAVGVIGIIAGIVPLAELLAVLASARFAEWLLRLVRSILPVPAPVAVALVALIAVVDITFGIGALVRHRWAFYGMVLRTLLAVPVDLVNFAAGNRAGAAVGLIVNVFVPWALLRAESRVWFRPASA